MVGTAGRNLVFILSTPRAGSTLLGALLGNHGSVFCPPEPWLLLPLTAIRSHSAVILSSYDHELARVAWQELADDELFHDAARDFAGTVYNTLLQRSGKSIFVDKTPRYYHILPFLDAVFPRAQKIWIKRDPLDVVASCKDSWGVPMAELMGEVISPFSFDATISHVLLASFFSSGGPEKTEIRYEDLVRDPAGELRLLCERVGIRYEDEMVNYGGNPDLVRAYAASSMGDKKLLGRQRPHTEAVGRWRAVLLPEEIRKVITTLGPNLFSQLGYDETFEGAAASIGLDIADVGKEGKIPALLERYTSYAETRLGDSAVVQDTLGARKERALRARLAQSQADRAARLQVIERQGDEISRLAAEVHRALEESRTLWERMERMAAERNALEAELADLRRQFVAAEADRAARLQVIERQGEEIGGLTAQLRESEAHRSAQAAVVEMQEGQIRTIMSQMRALQQVISTVQHTRAYHLLRGLGRWKFIDEMAADTSQPTRLDVGPGTT